MFHVSIITARTIQKTRQVLSTKLVFTKFPLNKMLLMLQTHHFQILQMVLIIKLVHKTVQQAVFNQNVMEPIVLKLNALAVVNHQLVASLIVP